jgi:DNA-binding NarL/FixJ family response regulator
MKRTIGVDINASVKRGPRKRTRLNPPLPKDSLTPREIEVCKLLTEGLQLKEVATRLNVSLRTADQHVRNTYQKLGVHRRAQLVTRLAKPNAPAERDSMSPPYQI